MYKKINFLVADYIDIFLDHYIMNKNYNSLTSDSTIPIFEYIDNTQHIHRDNEEDFEYIMDNLIKIRLPYT